MKIFLAILTLLVGFASSATFVVTSPVGASIKSSPDWHNVNDVCGTLAKSEQFNVTSVSGDWAKIKVTAGKTNVGVIGYVWVEAYANGKIGTSKAPQGAAILDRPGTDIYGKKTDFKNLGYLFPDTSVETLEIEITWVQLERKADSTWKQSWCWLGNGTYKK